MLCSMDKDDSIQIQMRHFKMENVRLHGEVRRLNRYVVFLEEENRAIESEVRVESQHTIDMLNYQLEVQKAKTEAMAREAESASRRADAAESALSDRDKQTLCGDKSTNKL